MPLLSRSRPAPDKQRRQEIFTTCGDIRERIEPLTAGTSRAFRVHRSETSSGGRSSAFFQTFQLQCPARSGSRHYNYNGFHSVVLLALVGPNYRCVLYVLGEDNGNVQLSTIHSIMSTFKEQWAPLLMRACF